MNGDTDGVHTRPDGEDPDGNGDDKPRIEDPWAASVRRYSTINARERSTMTENVNPEASEANGEELQKFEVDSEPTTVETRAAMVRESCGETDYSAPPSRRSTTKGLRKYERDHDDPRGL